MRVKIFVMGLISLLMVSCVLPLKKEAHINKYWQELFPDPTEKVCIIMKDKGIFRFTSYNEQRVYMSVKRVEKKLKKHDFKISDIEIIIHNHFYNCKFSESDKKQYRVFKRYGFNGLYLLYCHKSNKIYPLKE